MDPAELSSLHGAAEVEVAERATRCMSEAGYQYVVPAQPAPPPEVFIPSGATSADLIRQFGYGVWVVTTNIEILSSTGEQVAPESRVTTEMLEDEQFLETRAACRGSARSQVEFFRSQSIPESVAERVAEFRDSLWDHPSVVRRWSEWSRCMAGQGYAYDGREAISESLRPQTTELMRQVRLLAPGPGFSVPDDLAVSVQELAEVEERILMADLGCSDEVGLDTFLDDFELEQELSLIHI